MGYALGSDPYPRRFDRVEEVESCTFGHPVYLFRLLYFDVGFIAFLNFHWI